MFHTFKDSKKNSGQIYRLDENPKMNPFLKNEGFAPFFSPNYPPSLQMELRGFRAAIQVHKDEMKKRGAVGFFFTEKNQEEHGVHMCSLK